MTRRLWVTLSIALMAASTQAAVAPSQIEKIEVLIETGNWVELRAYLNANPQLLVGQTVLSQELREFMTQTENLFTALVFEPSIFPDTSQAEIDPSLDRPRRPPRTERSNSSNSGSNARSNGLSGQPVSSISRAAPTIY